MKPLNNSSPNPVAYLERNLNELWKNGGMFVPSYILWQGPDYNPVKDHFRGNPLYPKTKSLIQTLGTKFCSKSTDDFNTTCDFPMAVHKEFLSVVAPGSDENSRDSSVIVGNMLSHEFRVIKIADRGLNHEQVDLIHMRVDDRKNFRLLIVTSRSSGPGAQLQICADEYDSVKKGWTVRQENLQFQFGKFQSGAYCRNSSNDDVLLIIEGTNNRVCQYNTQTKVWSSCFVPEVTFSDGAAPAKCWNARIEDYGGLVILFRQYICGQEGYFTIHVLQNLDPDGNTTWEESENSRQKRSVEKGGFWVYPSVQAANPTEERISETGGCVYVFSLLWEADNRFLCISKYDPSVEKDSPWGPEERFQTPKSTVLRVENYSDEVTHALLLLYVEFLNKGALDKISRWEYIATGLWEWKAIDRCPKSVRRRFETLVKYYNKHMKAKGQLQPSAPCPFKPEIMNLLMEIGELKARAPKRPRSSAPVLASVDSAPCTSEGPASSVSLISASTLSLQPTASTGGTSAPFSAAMSAPPPAAIRIYQPAMESDTSNAIVEQLHVPLARPATPYNDPATNVELLKKDTDSQYHVSDYQRAVNAIELDDQELTESQKFMLFDMVSRRDLAMAEHRIRAANSGGELLSAANSNFEAGISVLQSLRDSSQSSLDKRFDVLMKNLETDILRYT